MIYLKYTMLPTFSVFLPVGLALLPWGGNNPWEVMPPEVSELLLMKGMHVFNGHE